MLTKDPKKRADWTEVFTFQVSQNGEIYDSKAKNMMFNSLKASTAPSVYSNRQAYIREQFEEPVQRVKKVESPQHFEGDRGDKFFSKSGFGKDSSLR